MQWTQLLTIGGGGAGYTLSANVFVAALVAPEQRTASFGILQGISFLGTGIGFTLGGILGDKFNLIAPFQVTFLLLVACTFLSAFFLPYVPPPTSSTPTSANATEPKGDGLFSFLTPLRVFIPQKILGADGKLRSFYGVTLLGVGAFMSVLATAYVPLMLQLTGTNRFGFKPTENGYLMSANSLIRAMFLTLLFPRIITCGRSFYATPQTPPCPLPSTIPTSIQQLPTTPLPFAPLPVILSAEEPTPLVPPTTQSKGSQFDLVFLRLSILADAILTGTLIFANQGWHLYLAASILPFASGTGPASKGTILEMVPPELEADALSAMALVETLATIVTVSVFGMAFAWFTQIGRPEGVFALNAATALLAAVILGFVGFAKQKQTTMTLQA